MNVYTGDKIRNVVLLGHGGCGKTTLVEAIAYKAGIITRMGKTSDGNTISDYDKEKNNQVCNTCKSKMNRVFIPIGNTIYSCGGFYDTDTRGVKCR